MTTQKHLKRLVRERMAETGERYVAARHHVVGDGARPGAAGAQVTASTGQPPFGIHPETWALRTVLTRLGVERPDSGEPWSEAALLTLGGGVGMGIFSFYYAAEDFASFYIAGRHLWDDSPAFLREATARLGLEVDVLESGSARTAEGNLRAALEAGRGVIASVDIEALGYWGWPPQTSGGGYHVVTVLGLDEARKVVTVQDLAAQPVDVPADVFARARARIKNQKNRLVTIVLPAPDAQARTREGFGSDRIADALRSCASGLDGTHEPEAGGRRGRNFNLSALETWADRLAGDRSAESWARVFPRGHRLWRGLTSINEYVDHAGTGGGLMRSMYAHGLGELAADGHSVLKNVGARYQELGAAWTDLAEAALPADVPAFRETADLIARRAQVVPDGGRAAADEAREIWRRLGEIEAEMREAFPLSQEDVDALLAELQGRVRAIAASERAAAVSMRELAGSLDGGRR